MKFHNRQDAYQWSEDQKPLGPCGLVIISGGFSHRYLLDMDGGHLSLFYLGMDTDGPVPPTATTVHSSPLTVH